MLALMKTLLQQTFWSRDFLSSTIMPGIAWQGRVGQVSQFFPNQEPTSTVRYGKVYPEYPAYHTNEEQGVQMLWQSIILQIISQPQTHPFKLQWFAFKVGDTLLQRFPLKSNSNGHVLQCTVGQSTAWYDGNNGNWQWPLPGNLQTDSSEPAFPVLRRANPSQGPP